MTSHGILSFLNNMPPKGAPCRPLHTALSIIRNDFEIKPRQKQKGRDRKTAPRPSIRRACSGSNTTSHLLAFELHAVPCLWRNTVPDRIAHQTQNHVFGHYPGSQSRVSTSDRAEATVGLSVEHVYSFARLLGRRQSRSFGIERFLEAKSAWPFTRLNLSSSQKAAQPFPSPVGESQAPPASTAHSSAFLTPYELNAILGHKFAWTQWRDGWFRPPPTMHKSEPTVDLMSSSSSAPVHAVNTLSFLIASRRYDFSITR